MFQKENYRKLYIDSVYELQKTNDVKNFYEIISDKITDKNRIKNEVTRNIYDLVWSIGNVKIKEINYVNQNDLLRINISYNMISESLKNEFKNYFGNKIIDVDIEEMIDIKSDTKYKITSYVESDFQGIYIDFEKLKNDDEIRIDMNEDMKILTGYDFDTITFAVK